MNEYSPATFDICSNYPMSFKGKWETVEVMVKRFFVRNESFLIYYNLLVYYNLIHITSQRRSPGVMYVRIYCMLYDKLNRWNNQCVTDKEWNRCHDFYNDNTRIWSWHCTRFTKYFSHVTIHENSIATRLLNNMQILEKLHAHSTLCLKRKVI